MGFEVVGIGNPLLDMTVEVDDEILEAEGLKKGQMHLVDQDQIEKLLNSLQKASIDTGAGGSVANTLAAVSALGGTSLLIGKIGRGVYGDDYERLTRESGINSALIRGDLLQGTCVVLITPDAERTMVTYLGAAVTLRKSDIPFEMIDGAKILHIEAYQLDSAEQTEALWAAMHYAKEKRVKISIDLADVALIQRHRELLTTLVKDFADIVFANETEAEEFTGKGPSEALVDLKNMVEIAIVKIGEKGSLVMTDEKTYNIDPFKVDAVNTTGAGDAYAGGFLYGYINDFSMELSGRIASFVGAQVVASDDSRINEKIRQRVLEMIKED